MRVRFSSLDPEISKTPISEVANKIRKCNDGKQLDLWLKFYQEGHVKVFIAVCQITASTCHS